LYIFTVIKYFRKKLFLMFIRLAKLTDIPAIMQLIAGVVQAMNASGNFQWDSTYPNEQVFEKDISLSQLWVAAVDGVIAGIAAITTDQEPEYAEVGWDINETAIVVHRLAVSPKYQGRGIAAALMMQAEQQAIERDINLLRIDTNTANKATQKLFPKLGYQFAGEIGLGFRPNLRFYCYEKKVHG
jgi:GNAT superfamily N-acetyltransferase